MVLGVLGLVVQAMRGRAERIAPTLAPPSREGCTRGWQRGSCKKRTCEICGLTWARDWRRGMFENLKSLGVEVAFASVTPPGQAELPYDGRVCAHLGPHKHGKGYGCRVNGDALAEWSRDLSKRWKRLHNAARNATRREMGRCLPLACRAWEPQSRGPGHVHLVFALHRPGDLELVKCYLAHVARLAPRHKFGFPGEKEGVSLQLMTGERAAAYVSTYFVKGKGGKPTLQENARNPHLPRLLIWVAPALTRKTRVTMRNLRRCRQLWAVRMRLPPAPSWSGIELARIVLLAGPWPARAP